MQFRGLVILLVLMQPVGGASATERPQWLSSPDGQRLGVAYDHCVREYRGSKTRPRTFAGVVARTVAGGAAGHWLGTVIPEIGPTAGTALGLLGGVALNAAIISHDSGRRSGRHRTHRANCRSKVALDALADYYDGADIIGAKRDVEDFLQQGGWRQR